MKSEKKLMDLVRITDKMIQSQKTKALVFPHEWILAYDVHTYLNKCMCGNCKPLSHMSDQAPPQGPLTALTAGLCPYSTE